MIKEKDIVHDAGSYWVLREKDCYYVMKTGVTHSTSDSAYQMDEDGLSIAKARCDYLSQGEVRK